MNEVSEGFTGIEINGVRFSNIGEMLRYMDKQREQLLQAKELIQKLITNAPNTYSGTNIEAQQKKMFSFQDAVNKAEQFLREVEK